MDVNGSYPLTIPLLQRPRRWRRCRPLRAEDKASGTLTAAAVRLMPSEIRYSMPFNAIHYLGGWSSIHFYRDWYFVYPFFEIFQGFVIVGWLHHINIILTAKSGDVRSHLCPIWTTEPLQTEVLPVTAMPRDAWRCGKGPPFLNQERKTMEASLFWELLVFNLCQNHPNSL